MSEVYMVCGVYKDDNEIIGYRLMGSDGRIRIEDREQTIRMIDNGSIRNMRVQYYNGEAVLRGKGININNLSIFAKNEMEADINRHNTYIISRAIVRDNKRVGYEIIGHNGDIKLVSNAILCSMIHENRIDNARLKKVEKGGKKVTAIVGTGININELEEIVISRNKIVTSANIWDNTCRAIRMRHSGILRDMKSAKMQRFQSGDYIVYCVNGKMYVVEAERAVRFIEGNADCDLNINKCEQYIIELSNGDNVSTKAKDVLTWKTAIVAMA